MKTRRNRKFVFFQILILVVFCSSCFALKDEIGNPTVPPSSTQSGLVKTPNPIDTSGNLIITGNVRGGTQFQGLVPYRATTEFGAPLGTGDIGSFLRRSAPLDYSSGSQFLPQPYHLPSSTVSSTIPGSRGAVLTYPSVGNSRRTGEFVMTEIPKVEKKTVIPAASPLYDYSRTRPLSYEPTDMEKIITYEKIREQNKKELSQALQKANEGIYKSPAEVDQQSGQAVKSTLTISQPNEPIKRSFERLEPLQPGEIAKVQTTRKSAVGDVYEQMLREAAKIMQPQAAEQNQPAEQKTKQVEKPKEKSPSDLRSDLAEVEKETAEAVVGVHKSFATRSNDKFNYYMRTAEEFLKQGKYYRAVDAYTLASIYKPEDPLAYAGRAHALFASGEYMSSAYFLARAINIFPQYVNFKIDLNAMIPDKDRLESRITDVKQWAGKTKSAELGFLLAYIYYQLDKTGLALEAINSAAEKMPDSVTVKILKQAIEKK